MKEYRNKVQGSIITFAKKDQSILDYAIVGSEAVGKHDKWFVIDVTFGVASIELHVIESTLMTMVKLLTEPLS